MYDIIIIGGGVIGTNILYELSHYKLKTLLLEKENDVSCGASRANSGIVHAGYDCKPGTLKAKFNALGNKMFPFITKKLGVPFQMTGSLVVTDRDGLSALQKLEEHAKSNGVSVEIIDRKRISALEPNIGDNIEYALYAPSAGIVSPYKLTIAFADFAALNGAEIKLSSKVDKISYSKSEGAYSVFCGDREYKAKAVINSAGTHSMEINKMAGAEIYPTEFRRGEYYVLDQTERNKVNTVIFPLPDENGKGILIAPSADGNVLLGPTSTVTENPDDNDVTYLGLDMVKKGISRTFKAVDFRKVIRVFAGLRSVSGDDFIIKRSQVLPNYIMLLGICSPGLSSSPAIAEYVRDMVLNIIPAGTKEVKPLPKQKKFIELTKDELNEMIKTDPRWGRLVCRCEKVSEAEVINAIHSPLPATSVDAVKRRTRAGMGRCQGGFCAPRVMEILSRELGIPVTKVNYKGDGSYVAIGGIKTKD